MLMLALRLSLKDKGGEQHYLSFVGSNLGIETFVKKREHQKRMHWSRGLRHLYILLYWGFKKSLRKACLLFNCFLVIKGILKVLFSFIPWLLNFTDWPNYGPNSSKRYTLRLLSKCLGRSTPSLSGVKSPPNPWIPSLISLDGPLLA